MDNGFSESLIGKSVRIYYSENNESTKPIIGLGFTFIQLTSYYSFRFGFIF